MADVTEPVLLEETHLIFRNFSGKEGDYNRAGDRNFGVLINEQQAELMAADDWNVKWLKPQNEDEEEILQAWLPVAVSYKGRPPTIVLISYDADSKMHRTNLGEDEVNMLDWADIITVDLIVNPYNWDVNGKTGLKAYLQSMFVTINVNPLEAKYAAMAENQPN